jgi:S1-C subfamily serine protease
MAENHTPQWGAPDSGNEPTTPLPRPVGDNPAATPGPNSPWARPLSGNEPTQVIAGGEPTAAIPNPTAGSAGASYPPPPPPNYPPPYGSAPGYPPGYGAAYTGSTPPYASQGGYPNAPYGQGYPNPGFYSPQQYYQVPTTVQTPKRRWPMVLLASALVLVMAVGGFGVTRSVISATSEPQITTPADPGSDPSTPSEGTAPSANPGTRSASVTAAQSKGVVLIESEVSNGVAAGTGMILTPDGKVLTNYHVVAGSDKVQVIVADTGDSYTATVLGFDQSRDVALLQLKGASGLATVTVDTDAVNEGDQIAAVGNASGGGKLVKAAGEVTATDQNLTVSSDSPWGNSEDLKGLIQTTAGAVPGDSGGPMFDAQTEVLGMTTAGSTTEHTSYAVPIATALSVVQQIETGQDAGTVRVGPSGYLGVVAATHTTGSKGIEISDVVAGGPADVAGITAGSRITKVGSTTITSKTNLANVVRDYEPGQQVRITWITSAGKTKAATVTLGSSPVN